ncbi:MAG TPA: hypothetical protein VFF06_00090 [Polyangia bacterium]|nr:hypothetical protein [Polyangia bacterium]
MSDMTQEQMTALVRDIADGKASWAPVRAELVMLGRMAAQIEPQMGTEGRPTFETLVAAWGQMAVGGDADARSILESLKTHPKQGAAASGWLARL